MYKMLLRIAIYEKKKYSNLKAPHYCGAFKIAQWQNFSKSSCFDFLNFIEWKTRWCGRFQSSTTN
jgi:hypothetical protein